MKRISEKLAEMTDKQRMTAFIVFVIVLLVIVTVAIVASTMLATNARENKQNAAPTGQTPVVDPENPVEEVPDSTTPIKIPNSPEDEEYPVAEETGPPEADEDHGVNSDDSESAVVAQSGVMAWCNILAEETFEQRQAKMAPYFDPSASEYSSEDFDGLIYERNCTYENTAFIADPADNGVIWHVTLLVRERGSENGTVQGGYRQYDVTVGNTGILSIDD